MDTYGTDLLDGSLSRGLLLQVSLVVEGLEEKLDEVLGLVLQEHLHLSLHHALQLFLGLVLLHQSNHVLGQSHWIGITAEIRPLHLLQR